MTNQTDNDDQAEALARIRRTIGYADKRVAPGEIAGAVELLLSSLAPLVAVFGDTPNIYPMDRRVADAAAHAMRASGAIDALGSLLGVAPEAAVRTAMRHLRHIADERDVIRHATRSWTRLAEILGLADYTGTREDLDAIVRDAELIRAFVDARSGPTPIWRRLAQGVEWLARRSDAYDRLVALVPELASPEGAQEVRRELDRASSRDEK